jgi:hypothetical protein
VKVVEYLLIVRTVKVREYQCIVLIHVLLTEELHLNKFATTMKTNFYITFGQRSPFRNGWVVIVASGKEEAQAEAHSVFGPHWSMCYSEEAFFKAREHFNKGKIGETIEGL